MRAAVYQEARAGGPPGKMFQFFPLWYYMVQTEAKTPDMKLEDVTLRNRAARYSLY